MVVAMAVLAERHKTVAASFRAEHAFMLINPRGMAVAVHVTDIDIARLFADLELVHAANLRRHRRFCSAFTATFLGRFSRSHSSALVNPISSNPAARSDVPGSLGRVYV